MGLKGSSQRGKARSGVGVAKNKKIADASVLNLAELFKIKGSRAEEATRVFQNYGFA
jgi:hypothetical protein